MTRRVVVTGADGFLGWHLRCRLQALSSDEVVGLDRAGLADAEVAQSALLTADVVIHAAGVNRGTDREVSEGNQAAALQLIQVCEAAGASPHVVYANSIHCDEDQPYGRGKKHAAELLAAWADRHRTTFADVRLPNLFGEHGRPHYNSVVATFCHLLAAGGSPEVHSDAELPLLHVQRAAAALMEAALKPTSGVTRVSGRPTRVTAIRDLLAAQAACYATGEFPDLSDPFERDLFNTYRASTFPQSFPVPITKHSDERGSLFECVRAHGGTGQTFLSTSRPGVTRGEHFHLNKVERFVVISGRGQIRLRRLFTESVVAFDVDGESPVIVDMPTMWAHSVTNTGATDLVTLFWTDDLFDPEHPDTYPEHVLTAQKVGV